MTLPATLPRLIQGGMGVGVSNWRLARAVSSMGQLGVVSGTVIDTVMVRRLQDGDPDGTVRWAIEHFPIPGVGAAVLDRYFLPDGRPEGTPYRLLPMYRQRVSAARDQVTMLAAFVEVFLAKEGHDGPVGINLLTKVQTPTLASLYGAMLAGVDYVLMGAGIPREIPAALDRLAEHAPASLRFEVEGDDTSNIESLTLVPTDHWTPTVQLTRPQFLAIVSATSLATTLARKSTGVVNGFVVEGFTAGGHNAPPRGAMQLTESGEPLYGDRDIPDLAKIRELGLPFWLAGGKATPEAMEEALALGAAGIQVGTLFAFAEESGIDATLKEQVFAGLREDRVSVFTDPRASPTSYPFKLLSIEGAPELQQDDTRERNCDLGYLRTAVRRPDGRIDYRCPAEPIKDYLAKGGTLEETVGRRCLCNGLVSNIGMAQPRESGFERPLLTSGTDLEPVRTLLGERHGYGAAAAVEYLLGLGMAGSRPAAVEEKVALR